MKRHITSLLLLLAACQSAPIDVGDADVQRQGGACEPIAPPSPQGILTDDDIKRVEALPYFASSAADVNETERLGTTSLTLEADGRAVLRVVLSEFDLRRTVTLELDVTDELEFDSGKMNASLDSKNAPIGSIAVNNENGSFVQGPIAHAEFSADPSGVFVLTALPGEFDVWPPAKQPTKEQTVVMNQLKDEIRVVGRLVGVCMTKLDTGRYGRLMDLSKRPECEDMLGFL